MIFKFTILSDEIDDFMRVIEIDSEATFLDFHNAILDSVNYEKNQITSFFICTDDWEKKQEITLIEMESSSEYDNLVMEDTVLEQLLDDEKQKLLFVFDMIYDRSFFIELSEIIPGRNMEKPVCIIFIGDVPKQIVEDSNLTVSTPSKTQLNTGESFYGDEDFDIEELDDEGFGDLSFDDASLFNDQKD